MHYIRLVRPASVNTSNPDAPILSLKLAITTDLGDTFLSTDEPVDLCLAAGKPNSGMSMERLPPLLNSVNGRVRWMAGMRVLKVEQPLTKDLICGRTSITIGSLGCGKDDVSALELQYLLPWHTKDHDISTGLVALLDVELVDGVASDIAVRSFASQALGRSLKIEEEIGESIARHIWDAGLLTTAMLADSVQNQRSGFRIHELMPIGKNTMNVLELGSGVGILGIGIARILYEAARVQGFQLEEATVLLTDLPEAEERATANINRDKENAIVGEYQAEILYENLDWENGSTGNFGPLVSSRYWDCIVLSDCTYNIDSFPILVATLSALHTLNIQNAPAGQGNTTLTKVMLSTKPRHDSEKALFHLLEDAGWRYRLMKSIPWLKLGEEAEVIEVYSIEKGQVIPAKDSKKRKNGEVPENPAKKGGTIKA